jgi:hypothetical protein
MSVRRSALVRFAQIVAFNVLLTAILLELALQAVHAARTRWDLPLLASIDRRLEIKDSWEEYFLSSYLTGSTIVYAGIHQPHPTRGWVPRPDAHASPEAGITYTTNKQGYRALYDYENDRRRYQVLVLGDSFTFGDEIDDAATWPALLQAGHPDLNVLNMGVSGYGIDQMLVTLEEEIPRYRPQLVICAFVTDDLQRSTLAFRDYKKPRFILGNAGLTLTNIPIGGIDTVVDEIAARRQRFYSYSPLQTVNLVSGLLSDLVPTATSRCGRECLDLNRALLDRMSGIATSHGADFLLLYLPWGDEIRDPHVHAYGETFFADYVGRRRVRGLDPRPELLHASFAKAEGHYRRDENLLLSARIRQKIETFDSWSRRAAP